MTRLDRRTFLTLTGGLLATTTIGAHPAAAAVPTFIALGDSYTAS
jgi:hypothetical protein